MKRDLLKTLQALYDSEINVTITTLWDNHYDVALCSPMEWDDFVNLSRNVRP